MHIMRTSVSKMLFTVSIGLLTACSQQSTSAIAAETTAPEIAARPTWIATLIAEYENQPVANPQREIIRYKFDGKTVYYMTPICCDIPSQLFNEEGKLLCYPDGGFTGRGDDRCPTFHKLKREEQLIWKDGRERRPMTKPK
jgi:hypothetical protein